MRVLLIHTGELSGSVELVGDMCAARHAYLESAGYDVILSHDTSIIDRSDHAARPGRRTVPSCESGAVAQRSSAWRNQSRDTSARVRAITKAEAIWRRAFAQKPTKVIP